MSESPGAPRRLSPTVVRLGVVSLLTDISSDMIVPLLPLFLTGTLKASNAFVGIVDGAAESLASFLKIAAGWLADRSGRNRPLTIAGYSVAAVARPLIAVATAPWHVLAVRLADRFGKGIRSAPRDAWIASVTAPEHRGRAYGFHRAMDNAGAFLGPLLGLLLYRVFDLPMRWVFALAAVPGLLGVFVLLTALAEDKPQAAPRPASKEAGSPASAGLPAAFKLYLAALFVFTLANSSDLFLVLKAKDIGLSETVILAMWTGLSGLRALFAQPGSLLSDRLGRRPTLLIGWTLYAVVYLGFSTAGSVWSFGALLAAYAGYYGLTEGVERAMVADLAPTARRGLAFGLFHGAVGLAALPGSWAFGAIADSWGMAAAFRVGAALALAGALLLAVLVRDRQTLRP